MDLIIGDFLLKNPIVWHFSDIKLKFSEVESVSEPFADFYSPKKLISVSDCFVNKFIIMYVQELMLYILFFFFFCIAYI